MEALKRIDLKNVIFLDIETVTEFEVLPLDTPTFESWKYKVDKKGTMTNNEIIESYSAEAALSADFSRIACISIGRIKGTELIVKTYADEDEGLLLANFTSDLGIFSSANGKTILAGQAIKGFDAPFIAKRCLINQIAPHSLVDVFGKKPWNVDDQMIDTKDLWQGTGFNASSLINIAVAMGIPSPKSDISGKDVGRVYFTEGAAGLTRIVEYCERDVLATANILRRWKFEPLLTMRSVVKIEVEKTNIVINLQSGGPFEKREQAELEAVIKALPEEDLDAAFTVLDAIAAKKGSKLTKTWMTKIRGKYGQAV